MDKLTDRLPARQRAHVHRDFLANEESYWMVRDSLLSSHTGKWVAVQAGKVIAEADDVFDILDRAAVIGGHPYIARVGFEERPFVIRRMFAASREAAYVTCQLPFMDAGMSVGI